MLLSQCNISILLPLYQNKETYEEFWKNVINLSLQLQMKTLTSFLGQLRPQLFYPASSVGVRIIKACGFGSFPQLFWFKDIPGVSELAHWTPSVMGSGGSGKSESTEPIKTCCTYQNSLSSDILQSFSLQNSQTKISLLLLTAEFIHNLLRKVWIWPVLEIDLCIKPKYRFLHSCEAYRSYCFPVGTKVQSGVCLIFLHVWCSKGGHFRKQHKDTFGYACLLAVDWAYTFVQQQNSFYL